MTEDVKKLIIVSSVLVVLIALTVTLLLVNVNLKLINLGSIKELIAKHGEAIQAEENLKKKETEYKNAVSKVNSSKSSFDTAKAKYEAISDETINVIKEATTEENYNIEYMWIRLGNYAKKNNLTIVMAEPGGSFTDSSSAPKDSTNKSTKTTTTTTTTTKNDDTSSTNNSSSSNSNSNSNSSSTKDTSTSNSTTSDDISSINQTAKDANDKNTLFKIQVSGSYLNVSDFVFEVENDKALRFKLDNISMDYVSGTTIKATFNVKNLVINK